jgi:GR25 family glycosyltransferase involved in LPS biosynthesis
MKIILRAVKEREDYVNYLKKYIDNLIVIYDTENNAMKTFLAAMKYAGKEKSVHIEDDIILTKDFSKKLNDVIWWKPNEVIQFFSMRKKDLDIGSRYERGSTFMMNQCFYLPEFYPELIHDYYPSWRQKDIHPTGYDILIADFLKDKKEKYWLHVPSLVQHRQCKSIINPKRSAFRQSITFQDPIYE